MIKDTRNKGLLDITLSEATSHICDIPRGGHTSGYVDNINAVMVVLADLDKLERGDIKEISLQIFDCGPYGFGDVEDTRYRCITKGLNGLELSMVNWTLGVHPIGRESLLFDREDTRTKGKLDIKLIFKTQIEGVELVILRSEKEMLADDLLWSGSEVYLRHVTDGSPID